MVLKRIILFLLVSKAVNGFTNTPTSHDFQSTSVSVSSKPITIPSLPRESSSNKSNLFRSSSSLASSSTAVSTENKKKNPIVAFFLLLVRQFQRLFYGKESFGDSSSALPLPVGSNGCPFFGSFPFGGSKNYGPGIFYSKMRQKYGASVWKFTFFRKSFAVVNGMDTVRGVLESEFQSPGIKTIENSNDIMGNQSLLLEQDKKRHSSLRRLVGNAMTPAAVAEAVPSLQASASAAIDSALSTIDTSSPKIVFESLSTDFTLDVAWKTILGLDLSEEEAVEFRVQVDEWIKGIVDPRATILPSFLFDPTKTAGWKAKDYLVDLVTTKIDILEKEGKSDGSTLGNMVFATDDEGDESGRRLTREEIIDNSLLLILAGSETSASTLTQAALMLGLNKEAWTKLQKEQMQLIEKYGSDAPLTKAILDKECPYLDAVIKETMRIKPIATGAPRFAKETIEVDGKQIPQGWPIMFNVRVTHENDPVTGGEMNAESDFKPERWFTPETQPQDYIPFGIGPRFCLGYNLANVEMRVFLAMLARKLKSYELVQKDDIKWKPLSIMPLPQCGAEAVVETA